MSPEKIRDIESKVGHDVGLIHQDKYWIWLNDACKFPSGNEGVYGRILWTHALEIPFPGVAVMPMLPDGKIALNCNFRHATRSWEIELPRGLVEKGESIEEAAQREAAEETGMTVDQLNLLGKIPPDSGLTGTVVPVFMARVIDRQQAHPEENEAIEAIISLTIAEIKQAFVNGFYECLIKGKLQRVNFRDPFLAYALLLYEIHQSTNDDV